MAPPISIAVIGAAGVGKTACTIRYLKNMFIAEWDPTISESYKKTVVVDGHQVELELHDTAGQKEFDMFLETTMQFADGYFVVFSADRQESLPRAKALIAQARAHGRPIMLVANKNDLPGDNTLVEEAKAWALGESIEFGDCSALSGTSSAKIEQLISMVLAAQITVPHSAGCLDRCVVS